MLQRQLVVTELSDRTVMEAALMGMALSPGQLLSVHVGRFAEINGGFPLTHNRLVAALMLLTAAHPGHKQRFTGKAPFWGIAHGCLPST
jgi:hypothetical protein